MRRLFAERIRKPRKSAHRHSHGQVLPFHVGRTDLVRVRIALSTLDITPQCVVWSSVLRANRTGRGRQIPWLAEQQRSIRTLPEFGDQQVSSDQAIGGVI